MSGEGAEPSPEGAGTDGEVPDGSGADDDASAGDDPDPVRVGEYTWEEFGRDHGYGGDGGTTRRGGVLGRLRGRRGDAGRRSSDGDGGGDGGFDPVAYLGFHPDDTDAVLTDAVSRVARLGELADRRTVDVGTDLDEDGFFTTPEGRSTLVDRYDLEKAVPTEKKLHFEEVERYWVNSPYAFVVVFHSRKENEKRYYVVEPYLNELERDLKSYLAGKLRRAIKYSDEALLIDESDENRASVIEHETQRLLDRYDLYSSNGGLGGLFGRAMDLLTGGRKSDGDGGDLEGLATRPEPAVLDEDAGTLTEAQVEKLLYLLKRDFIGYERIDPIKHDINVEDISCDGYHSPVFVYHTDYENVITNVSHGGTDLDNFVVKMAQRSGKGISKRRPQVDASLPDGSRAQLTLGREVSDHGTNYTIRQFKDVPFTPVDLVNWHTFGLDEVVFLWLCIENHRSLIFAGGTASGKTTSLNAVSLFIPSNTKIVSIEDTREVELPQRNWVASVTRPSFADEEGAVDEFDLLEAALRQRPEFILMGEVRGEEGRTLFQVMSTGHATLTTFHADTVGEVLKRFTTDPINVSKTMFSGLDLVSVQTQTRVRGEKVRRNKAITEINHYDPENDEINVRDVFEWRAESDEFVRPGASNTLEKICFDRGWDRERLDSELLKRRAVLAYLIVNDLNEYSQVAATLQAFINDPETILGLVARGELEGSLADLRGMETVRIDTDPQKEALVPRPDPSAHTYERAEEVLEEAEERLFGDYEDVARGSVFSALPDPEDGEVVTIGRPGRGGVFGPDPARTAGEESAPEDGPVDAHGAETDGGREEPDGGPDTGDSAGSGGDDPPGSGGDGADGGD